MSEKRYLTDQQKAIEEAAGMGIDFGMAAVHEVGRGEARAAIGGNEPVELRELRDKADEWRKNADAIRKNCEDLKNPKSAFQICQGCEFHAIGLEQCAKEIEHWVEAALARTPARVGGK